MLDKEFSRLNVLSVATLEAQGKVFNVEISDTDLNATNGSLDLVSNAISGTLVLDGDTIEIGGALNPTFTQASFDDSYRCTENLAHVLN